MKANGWLAMLRMGGEPRRLAQLNILEALESAGGHIPAVSEALECSERTVHRLLSEADLVEQGAKIRHRAGLRDTRNAHLFEGEK